MPMPRQAPGWRPGRGLPVASPGDIPFYTPNRPADNPAGSVFGSGIRPRCFVTASSGDTMASTGFTVPLTGWLNARAGVTGQAPQPGDLVVLSGSLFQQSRPLVQSGGIGTWTIQSNTNNTNLPTAESFIAYRIFDGTETAPSFTLGLGGRWTYELVAIAPEAGNTISIDAWATELVDAASTTHSPPADTSAGTGEFSLLLGNFFVSQAGIDPTTIVWPAGWTEIAEVREAGSTAQHIQMTSMAWQTGVGSGTLTPGAVTNSLSSTATIDHLLVKQTPTGGGTLSETATLSGSGTFGGYWPRFKAVGLSGVGTVNTMAKNSAGVIVMGGDTHGYYRSIDDGDHWQCIDRGVGGVGVSDSFRQSASTVWSTTETNTLYSGVGEASIGNDGGLLVSTDGGISWNLRTAVPQFAGNHEFAPLPTGGTPRSTGLLFAQDNGFLFAATYNQGVLRSANNGTDNFPVACTMAGVAPGTNYYARSILVDPNNANTMYVAMYDYNGTGTFGHVWKCTNDAATTPDFTKLTTSPASVEELRFIGTSLYAVAGSAGVFRSDDFGATWTNINGAGVPTAGGQDWFSVDGYADASGNHIVYICDTNPAVASQCIISLHIPSTWPTTGSITYVNETGSIQLSTLPPDNRSWWNTGGACLGRLSWQNGHVAVDASNLSNVKVYSFGPGGFFRNIGGTGWTVASNGQPGFPARSMAADPNDANHFQLTATDWGTFDISDGIAHDASTTVNLVSPGAGQQGYGVSFDPTDSTVYAAFGDKGVAPTWGTNSNGSIAHRATGSTSWTTDGPSVASKVALGLCALRDGSATKILLAAVWNSGMWRGVWGGSTFTWTQVSSAFCNTSASPGGGNQFIFAHPAGSQYVYVFDPDKGVYRSNDYGVTWVQVYAVTSTDKNSIAVTASETTPGEIYLTTNGSLYKITNAHTGTVAATTATLTGPITLPGSAHAGCLAAKPDGTIYVSTEDVPGSLGTQIFGSADHGSTWIDVVGDGSLSMSNSRPIQMVIAADGRLYLAGSNVVTQGYPLTLPTVLFLNDSGSESDGLSTTAAISLTDSGSGSDALTLAVARPLADSGAGSDVLTITVAAPLIDAGAGTDTLAVVTSAAIPLSETGAGTDSLTSAAATALTDSGTASDSLAVTTATPLTTSGTGTDALAATAAIPLADSGAGTDALAVATGTLVPLAESGAGTDALAATATAPLADSGTASDVLTSAATASLADSGIGSDALATADAIALTDAGTGSDALAVRVSLTDAGTATDTLALSVPVVDSGAATDSLGISVTLADSGAVTDALSASATAPLADSGTGNDALIAGTGTPIGLADSGAGTDALAVSATAPLTDSGTATDSLVTAATAPLADTGAGSDTLAVRVSLTDSGIGSDTLTTPASIALTDSSAGADSLALSVGLNDSGSGTDTVAAPASVSLTDSGAGADSILAGAGTPVGLPDSGAGADSLASSATAPLTDSATASDAIVTSHALADTGTGADSLSAGQQTLFSETGTGADSLTVVVQLTDTATGTDTLVEATAVAFTESGSGTDSISLIIQLSETGTAADNLTVTVTVPLADTAAGTDTLGTNQTNFLNFTETGTGSDALTIGIKFAESATASDAFIFSATAVLGELAFGTDTLNVSATVAISDSGSGNDLLILRIASAVVITAGLGGYVTTDRIDGSVTTDKLGGDVQQDKIAGATTT